MLGLLLQQGCEIMNIYGLRAFTGNESRETSSKGEINRKWKPQQGTTSQLHTHVHVRVWSVYILFSLGVESENDGEPELYKKRMETLN